MRERPILFNGAMVRAILAGRKTVTRRVVKSQSFDQFVERDIRKCKPMIRKKYEFMGCDPDVEISLKPFCQINDRLWVRETHTVIRESTDYETGNEYLAFQWDPSIYGEAKDYLANEMRGGYRSAVVYRADDEETWPTEISMGEISWRPSIFMPRWACRIQLEVIDVRVERVQEITDEDAKAEGCRPQNFLQSQIDADKKHYAGPHALTFAELWDSINGPRGFGWSVNPWVWRVEFRRLT